MRYLSARSPRDSRLAGTGLLIVDAEPLLNRSNASGRRGFLACCWRSPLSSRRCADGNRRGIRRASCFGSTSSDLRGRMGLRRRREMFFREPGSNPVPSLGHRVVMASLVRMGFKPARASPSSPRVGHGI